MVALAAAIAIIGLIMNDGSSSRGNARFSVNEPYRWNCMWNCAGNLDLIRRSGESTFRGMAVVLGGVVMTFILPMWSHGPDSVQNPSWDI
jgi:hypothetical protein